MSHLGDITKLDGGKIPPVHIITFGSPCQDLSTAGWRKGLDGGKSSLFYHAIRIIKEMRCATNNVYPVIAVWENVMGAFSSNNRMDFRAVLKSFTDTEIPMPASGRWANAGMVRGTEPDLAWRLMDARYWGQPPPPQRRKRIFIVADFTGQRAGEILFKSHGMLKNPAACTAAGCPPPAEIEYLLKKQGGNYLSSTPFNSDVCEERQKKKTPHGLSAASDEQLTLFPLCWPAET